MSPKVDLNPGRLRAAVERLAADQRVAEALARARLQAREPEDHVAVRDAALAVTRSPGLPLRLFADLPYAAAFGWPSPVTGARRTRGSAWPRTGTRSSPT